MRGSILWFLHHSEALVHISKNMRAFCMLCSIDMPTQSCGVGEAEGWDERIRGDLPLGALYAGVQ